MDDTSVKWSIIKTFVFHPISMKLGEVVVHIRVFHFAKSLKFLG